MSSSTPENLLDGAAATTAEQGGCGGHCTCGADAEVAPELDVRMIPPAVRHAAIFGALGAIAPGKSIILIAPHEPVPLLAQLQAEQPGQWTSAVETAGPDAWHVRVTRSA